MTENTPLRGDGDHETPNNGQGASASAARPANEETAQAPSASPDWLRPLWLGLGWAFLGLGLLGVFLPLLPTTPFVLLTAACFARGSDRWHAWLLRNRLFGPVLRDWRQGGAISLKSKCVATAMLVGLIGWQVGIAPRPFPLKVFLVLLAASVIAFLFSRPSVPIPVAVEPDPEASSVPPGRLSVTSD